MRHPTPAQVAWSVACGVLGVVGMGVYFLGPDLRGRLPRVVTVPSFARRS